MLPRVAALLDVNQLSDISAVVSADTFKRSIYAGNAVATVQSCDAVKVATVRGTAFDAVAAEGGSATIEAVGEAIASQRSRFVGEELAVSDRPELTAASIVVSGGRGMGNGDNFNILYALADKLGAAVGLREQPLMLALYRMICKLAKRVKWWLPTYTSLWVFLVLSST